MLRRAAHWSQAYDTKGAQGVSWYQEVAQPSVDLITEIAPSSDASLIDVGAGASRLVDVLLDRGYVDVTVLDVAASALREARERLGDRADDPTWIESDLLAWQPQRRYDVWHDRAVFHFLTDPEDRKRYVELARSAVTSTGHVVLGTFAEDGPESCSGLAVARYDGHALAAEFADGFDLRASLRAEHVTPWGSVQPFTWVVLVRRPD